MWPDRLNQRKKSVNRAKPVETKVTPVYQPHDSIFRAALSDIRVAQEFLTCYLPEQLSSSIDFCTLKLQPDSYIDSQLKRSQSDVLYEAQINDKQGYVYLLFEHFSQSSP
jgi:predicted transposase/invertase (TIGR01784 family)